MSAPTPAPLEPPEKSVERRWYGWQTLSFDLGALGLALTANALGDSSDVGAGITGYGAAASYALAPPVVHLVHGHVGKAAGSFGLRVGLPVVALLLGRGASGGACQSEIEDENRCQLDNYVGWALGGAVVAAAIDGLVIARETVPDVTSSLPTPYVAPGPHGTMVFGVTGRL